MLLVGVCIGAISLEDSFTLFSEAKQHEPLYPSNSAPGYIPKRNLHINNRRHVFKKGITALFIIVKH